MSKQQDQLYKLLLDFAQKNNARADQMQQFQMGNFVPIRDAFMSRYINGSEGFDPASVNLAKSQFTDSTNTQFRNSLSSVKSMLGKRGFYGGGTNSGYAGGQFGNLEAQRAATLAGGLRDIDIQNLQQANSNRFAAANTITSGSSQFNPSAAYNNGTGLLGLAAGLTNKSPGLGSLALSSGIGALGSAMINRNSGGLF